MVDIVGIFDFLVGRGSSHIVLDSACLHLTVLNIIRAYLLPNLVHRSQCSLPSEYLQCFRGEGASTDCPFQVVCTILFPYESPTIP